MRESPAIDILSFLSSKGAHIEVYDPFVPDKSTVTSLKEVLEKCDCLLIATDHSEFLSLDPKGLEESGILVVIDGRNCLDKQSFTKSKVVYKGIGR
jgi:UDP-N-acetyl-D-mannosaminuronate dehydrogenase